LESALSINALATRMSLSNDWPLNLGAPTQARCERFLTVKEEQRNQCDDVAVIGNMLHDGDESPRRKMNILRPSIMVGGKLNVIT
jgi:hypothetical protein